MSFQDIGARLFSKGKPSVRAMSTFNHQEKLPPKPSMKPTISGVETNRRYNSENILTQNAKGRQNFTVDDASSKTEQSTSVASHTSMESSVRCKSRQGSVFSRLMHETQQYQKIVSTLESILTPSKSKTREAVGECPESTWRARILMRSAEDTDKDLCAKLDAYEQSLSQPKTSGNAARRKGKEYRDIRMAKVGCMKLRRDFNRSHKVLMSCITLYEKRQQVEINQLLAVGWNSQTNTPPLKGNNAANSAEHEDFFDAAMRQRDLERLNESMEKVKDIYHDLAGIVNSQQEKIDKLEKEVDYATTNVKDAADNINCFYYRQNIEMLGCGADNAGDDDPAMFSCGALSPIARGVGCSNNRIRSIDASILGPIARGVGCSSNPLQTFDSKITFTDESPQRHRKLWRNDKYNFQETSTSIAEEDADYHHSFIRVNESFHWLMPFETLREDMCSVQDDIVSVGKGVAKKAGNQLNCGAVP